MNKSDEKIFNAMQASKMFLSTTSTSFYQEGGGLSLVGCEIYNYLMLQEMYGMNKRKLSGEYRNLYNAL